MDWTTWSCWRVHRRQIEAMVDQVADRCRGFLLPRVLPQVAAMTVAEARGYIRARATAAASRQATIAVAERGLPSRMAPALAMAAKEELVRQILAEARTRRSVAALGKAA